MDALLPLLAVLVTGASSALAFSDRYATRPAVLYILLASSGLLALLAFWRMWRDGTLLDLFRWRFGDVTTGFLSALGLGVGVFLGRQFVAPHDGPGNAWVARLYLQLGPLPADRTANLLFTLAILAIAVLEEIGWRGMVQQVIEERLGVRRGWVITALLYALAHAPTLWTLAMPPVGKNPLLVMVALLGGVVWGFLVARKQRLPPALLSHAMFTYGLAVQFRLWGP